MEAPDSAHAGPYRKVGFEFLIPFGGGPAMACADMIHRQVRQCVLDSLSSIHPDIRVTITEASVPIESADG